MVGITFVLDKFTPVDEWYLSSFNRYITYVKIGWGLPLILEQEKLKERISLFHNYNLHVSSGGTLLEYFLLRRTRMKFIDFILKNDFDIIELSHGASSPLRVDLEQIAEQAKAHGLIVVAEIGKKSPWQQLTYDEIKHWTKLYRSLGVTKIIIESREWGLNTCIFDGMGNIKWDMVRNFLRLVNYEDLIFEAPLPKQQVELIRELGPDVNLGNVSFLDVPSVESMRRGLRGDLILETIPREKGMVSTKLIELVLKHYGPMSISELVEKTGLSRRSLYVALKQLKELGIVRSFKSESSKEKIWSLA